ncbi:MAG: tetratricopeptide repeat protein [Spirochaetales bacterium]|nr:tetratricopeptide repeat protein [Spirochaetales bacterium]
MFGFFHKNKQILGAGGVFLEHWTMRKGLFGTVRFSDARGDGYAASSSKEGLYLELLRSNLFAWMDNPEARYRDLLLDADLSVDAYNGYSSVGFILRQTGESEYYYFLVSTRGFFRFDIVLNGHPEEIIGWTPLEPAPSRDFRLRIVADGPSFSFYVDESWVGEAADDRLDAGTVAFCAQNYDEKEKAVFTCFRLEVESRPERISRWDLERQSSLLPQPSARRRLAESLFASGRYLEQTRQLQRIVVPEGGIAEDFYRMAQGFIHLNMYDRALKMLDKALLRDPVHSPARLARADMLYLTGRITELNSGLAELIRDFPANPFLLNLAGNASFAEERWDEALERYGRAAALDREEPLYLDHLARALERTGADAREAFSDAAAAYFIKENYADAARVTAYLESKETLSQKMKVLKGKLLFQEGDFSKALEVFQELVSEGFRDGSVFYLLGLIHSSDGRRDEALWFFRAAVEEEPGFYLYRFRLAEHLFLRGEDCQGELDKALELAPEDGWVLNLAGLVYMEKQDYARAERFMEKASRALPEERDVLINFSQACFHGGNHDKAFELLQNSLEYPEVRNHLANLYSRLGDFDKAVEEYTAASRLDPEQPEYQENLAAAYIENDMPLKAEELLSKVLEVHPGERAYNLMGHCLSIMGEYLRAEAAYRQAIRQAPSWEEPRLNLADMYITMGAPEQAAVLLEGFKESSRERARRIMEKLDRLTTETLRCASCGREWKVPRKIDPPESLRLIGEPPGDLPAGSCPSCHRVFCVACASEHLKEQRFVCPFCGDYLKLKDPRVRHLLKKYMDSRESDSADSQGGKISSP